MPRGEVEAQSAKADFVPVQRRVSNPPGAGFGIHWPEIDEDLSTDGLLRGLRAPRGSFTAA